MRPAQVRAGHGGVARFGLAACFVAVSCGPAGPAGPAGPSSASVSFTYRSLVSGGPPLTGEDAATALGCIHHYSAFGGVYVLFGSWNGADGSDPVRLRNPEGDCRTGCRFVAADVPAGVRQAVAVMDLGLCQARPHEAPFALAEITANGVRLDHPFDHPAGLHGVALGVDAGGAVSP